MEQKDGVSTRLWIEKHAHQTDSSKPGASSYSRKKVKLDKKLILKINQYLKKHHLAWDALLHTAFGNLLCRLSSSSSANYGTGDVPIVFELTKQLSIKSCLLRTKKMLAKKNRGTNENVNIRYLLLTVAKKIKKPLSPLQPTDYPLIVIGNRIKPNELVFYFHPQKFAKEDIDFFATHLLLLIENICTASPTQKIHSLDILTQAERKKILNDWRRINKKNNQQLASQCIHDLFGKQAQIAPNNMAVKHNNETVSYKELYNATLSITDTLLKSGVKKGDRVCVLMDRTPTLFAAMMAIFRCGAIFVPINPKYPDERVTFVIDDSSPAVTLTNDLNELPDKYKENACIIPKSIRQLPPTKNNSKVATELNDVAYIVYTSGTTGTPKGVMIKHKSLTNFAKWYEICFNLTTKDRASQFASQGFDSFFCETLPFFAIGASISIVDDNIKLTPPLFLDWLKTNDITICDITTAYGQILFCVPWPKNMKLRVLKIGGEALAHYPNQAFTFDIWNTYGPTEATIEATFCKIYSANSPSLFISNKEAPPIGKPIINSEVYIVDPCFQLVPPGIAGELLIGGDNISPGYLNRDELTNQRFISIMIEGAKTGKLYRTGDLVKWRPDGNIDFVGRIDHQIKIRGYRIEPSEIEQAISLHPDVKEAVVITKDNVNSEKSIIAYIVPNLNKERFLYQQRCLVSINKDHFFEAITDDISNEGLSISGVPDNLTIGVNVIIHVKLPGMNDSKPFNATVIWSNNARCGLKYLFHRDNEKNIVSKSINHYLSTHNVMDMILSNAAKRSLKKALQKKMPEYMIPSAFVKLLDLPLNYSGKVDVKSLPPPQSVDDLFRDKFIPPKTSTEKKLAQIWSDLLNKNDISMSDNFFEIGGTSITAAGLSIKVLQEFNIVIPVKLLFDLSFIPVLSDYIDSNGKSYSDKTRIQEEIARDSELSNQIQPTEMLSPRLHIPQHILLTGAGGFLGVYLLSELLEKTDAKIYCLVRHGEFESAAKRLEATISSFNLQNKVSLSNRRIVILSGDLNHDRLGLPQDHYNSLLNKIDLIYHCGAQVNIMASYNKLRGSNMHGTLEIIKLATTGQDKPIHYISTLSSAYCTDKDGLLTEIFPTETYRHLFGGYAISKWVSERLLTQAKDRGLPVTIYRSGYIFGHSETGVTSLNDALLMLIKGCIQLKHAPIMKEKITILPVDFVSKAIVAISLAQESNSDVFHIDHPTGIMWSDLVAWLNDYGYQIKKISMHEWQQLLKTIPTDNALYPFLPYYLSLGDSYSSPDVSVTKATQKLTQLSLPYPAIDDKQLNTYIDYLCRVGFLPAPLKKERAHE